MDKTLRRAQKLLNQPKSDADKIISLLTKHLQHNHSSWMAYHFMGMAYLKKKEYEKAISSFEQAIQNGADDPGTFYFLSRAFFRTGNYAKSELHARRAVDLKEDYFEGWMQAGAASRAQGKLNEALNCYQKANQVDPKSAEVAFRIASIYRNQGNNDQALKLLNITLKIDPQYLEAYTEKAAVLKRQGKMGEAEECLRASLNINRNFIKAEAALAELAKTDGDYEKALAIYESLLKRYPKVGGLRVNYALCQLEIGRFEESEKNYLQAFRENPEIKETFSNYLMGLHYNPKRTKEEIFEAHLLWDKYYSAQLKPERPVPQNRNKEKKLRLGLLSGGLRAHPVGWMITPAIENLPDDQFEIYSYSTNNKIDFITKRIYDRCDAWRQVTGYTEEVIAGMIRDDEIDILVELSGHSADNKLRTVNMEPAPVIVKWVGGLFNTTGLKSVDFLITDWNETPTGEEEFYTEKLVRLPDDYICFLPSEYSPDVEELPAVQNEGITFGCFNNPTKINDVILGVWAEILNRIPKSRLFLKSRQYDTQALKTRIIDKMKECGVSEDRLIFEGVSPHAELLESYNRVDIALDPWPYSGGLTTCEALWMGVPVITKPGPTFAGRHSATHLMNAGFSEWVTDSWEEYVAKAVSLANDLKSLRELRLSLRDKVAESTLCDGKRFGTHLALAFREMWKQWVEGNEKNIANWQKHIEIDSTEKKDQNSLCIIKDESWKSCLQSLPWAKGFMVDWEQKSNEMEFQRYFEALNHLCKAESLTTEKGEPDKADLLLRSAEILVDLYNNGVRTIPIAFTLARVFGILGKKSEAAEVIKEVLEHEISGKNRPVIDLPFLPPVSMQDSAPLQTDIKNWLTVRAVESWILLNDSSTLYGDERIKSLLRGLQGNPETLPEINELARNVFGSEGRNGKAGNDSGKKGKFLHFCFNHVYGKTISDLVEYTNQHSNQEHWLYLEKRNAINGYSADISKNPHTTFFDFKEHLGTVISRSMEHDVDGLFIHGLFFDWQKELIRKVQDKKHIGWIIWGGDLYNPVKDKQPLHETVQNINSIHSIVEGDVELFGEIYGERPNYEFGYPYPGLYGKLPEVRAEEKSPQIIVGNSGDASNNHIEILKVLAEKTDIQDFNLLLPVSYNFTPEYERELNNWIQKIELEEQVQLIRRFIAPDEYLHLVSKSRMLITAHHRQQAVGNLLASLYSGNNTFLREQINVDDKDILNPGWEFLKSHNFRANSFNELIEVRAISDIQPVSEKQQAIHRSVVQEEFGLEKRSKELVEACRAILEREMQTV